MTTASLEYQRAYREKNREKIRANQRKWQRLMGNAYYDRRKSDPAFRERHRARNAAYKRNNREKLLLDNARKRSKERGLECTISLKDIVIPDRCPIFGCELFTDPKRRNSPTLDRIDPLRGYVPGNVWVISHRANAIKNDGTPEEHEQIAAAVRKKLGESP